MNIDQDAFEFAITKIEDGFVFEKFGTNFLAAVLGSEFIPVGGTKDKGVDAFQHLYTRSNVDKTVFQLSTELGHEEKIYDTITKLSKNEIQFSRLFYITNRKINNAETFVDEVFNKTGVHLTIYDIRWLAANSNKNETSIKAYQVFVDSYLHEYAKPGKVVTVANLSEDSRLFVFLGQQFDATKEQLKLDDLLADTLILFALEGTDPDKEKLMSEAQVKTSIAKYLKFDPRLLDAKITERLHALTSKPRKIQFHPKKSGYCLPFETRVEIEQRNLTYEAMYSAFYTQTAETIAKYFDETEVRVRDVQTLITAVFNKIFLKQGLEFSNFVLQGHSNDSLEQNLNDVISKAVDESNVILRNKEKVKTALHLAIRDIVYNGSPEQISFLKSLSHTYMMMFLLQWEPKLSIYFQTLASQLRVFVDNSIIIPALSEYYLPDNNRRHWNLLMGAKKAGISLFINETLLDELASHFRMVKNKYYTFFHEQERFYLNDELEILFIDEIMIRAYFYAKSKGQVRHFDSFMDNFVDPGLKTVKDELITFLKEQFGITYISNAAWDIKVNENEKEALSEVLMEKKSYEVKARNDAEMILAIYHLRNKHNEVSDTGIFGYKTWWLSKDTSTYRAVVKCFGPEKYPVSCYIRPDFIYNYIAFRPTESEVAESYREIFPTMLGINLSYHMPKEVSIAVQEKIKEYHSKPAIRVKQILRNLADRLKSDPSLQTKGAVEHFLDDQLRNLDDDQEKS
jgi:hypothetical protein